MFCRTGWAETEKGGCVHSAINTAVKARADSRRRDRLQTGHALESDAPIAKFRVDPISRIGQNSVTVQVCLHRRTDLVWCDRRLRLKRNLFGHFRLFPALGILGPFLGQIQSILNRAEAGSGCVPCRAVSFRR